MYAVSVPLSWLNAAQIAVPDKCGDFFQWNGLGLFAGFVKQTELHALGVFRVKSDRPTWRQADTAFLEELYVPFCRVFLS